MCDVAALISTCLTMVLASLFQVCAGRGYCSFPSFLWEPLQDGGPRMWLSRVEYIRDTDTWQKRKEITVNDTEINVRMKLHASCSERRMSSAGGPGSSVPCYRQDALYRISCLSEEPDMKFRVQVISNDRHMFSCMKFVRRSPGVVQVFQAVPIDVNEHRLCYDATLQRDEWPWIDVSQPSSQHCSISGGFDFRGYLGESRQKLCSNEWRPSRVESECLRGDGVSFYFPNPECSPFNDHAVAQTLNCWSEWTEDGYIFFLMYEPSKYPKYILRLTRSMHSAAAATSSTLRFSDAAASVQLSSQSASSAPSSSSSEAAAAAAVASPRGDDQTGSAPFSSASSGHQTSSSSATSATASAGNQFLGFLYLSPVAPLSSHGNPPSRIMFIEMHMQRSEVGTCIDETEDCREMAANGRCYGDNAVNHNVNYCLRSCGMCELAPSIRPECHFAKEHIGQWLQFDDDGTVVKFDISAGVIRTSSLGTFVCKGKHWQHPYYKVLSIFENGCRPRYTCIHLLDSGDILQYRLSRSSMSDDSFNLCEFRDETSTAAGNSMQSSEMKTLISITNLKFNSCGLDATWRTNVTFYDGTSCDAALSDVDDFTCSTGSSLKLTMNRCSSERRPTSIDFTCIARAQLSTGTRLLVTTSRPTDTISNLQQQQQQQETPICWIVRPNWPRPRLNGAEDGSLAQHHSLTFTRGRCSTAETITSFSASQVGAVYIRALTTYQDQTIDKCNRRVQSSADTLVHINRANDSVMSSSAAAAGQRVKQTSQRDSHLVHDGGGTGNSGWSAPTIRRQPEYRRGGSSKPDFAFGNGGIRRLSFSVWRNCIACVPIVSLILVTSSFFVSTVT